MSVPDKGAPLTRKRASAPPVALVAKAKRDPVGIRNQKKGNF